MVSHLFKIFNMLSNILESVGVPQTQKGQKLAFQYI